MKYLALFFTLFITVSINAQSDLITTLSELNKKQEIITDIDLITEHTFQLFRGEEEAEPDTVILYNEKEVKLYLNSTKTIAYPAPTEIEEKYLDINGEPTLTVTVKLREDGRFISSKTDMGDNPAAATMNFNSFKEYHYDDQDRIVSIFENGVEIMHLTYADDGYLTQMTMDAGLGKMEMTAEQLDELTRYNISIDFTSMIEGEEEEDVDIAQFFADALSEAPKEYIELIKGKSKNIYTGFKVDKETGESRKEWENTSNNKYQMLIEKKFSPDGELAHHYEYVYHPNGELSEKKDVLANTSWLNQFDEHGHLTLEHEGYSMKKHRYDEKGNLIQTIQLSKDENVWDVVVRHIDYK